MSLNPTTTEEPDMKCVDIPGYTCIGCLKLLRFKANDAVPSLMAYET